MNMLHAGRVIVGRSDAHARQAMRRPGLLGRTLLRRLVGAVMALADAASLGRTIDGELSLEERLQRMSRIRYR